MSYTITELAEWKSVKDFEGLYEVNRSGQIRNARTGYILKTRCGVNNRYPVVTLSRAGKAVTKLIHRAVAEAFIPNPNNLPVVNHLDNNPTNYSISNLEWTTLSGNSHHCYDQGRNPGRSRAVNKLDENGNIIETFGTVLAAANNAEISDRTMSKICRANKECSGYYWRYADDEVPSLDREYDQKEIEGYPKYSITNTGEVYSKRSKKFLKKIVGPKGYHEVSIYNDKGSARVKIHNLVAKAFIPNPNEKPIVNHKDGNRVNNKVENLEWVTTSENTLHARDTGLLDDKKPVCQFDTDGKFIAEYKSIIEASKSIGVGKRPNISKCCKGKCRGTGGFFWQYTEDCIKDGDIYRSKTAPQKSRTKLLVTPVSQFSLDGELIKSYPSIKQASIETGIDASCIGKVCRGLNKTIGGFKWTYHHIPDAHSSG